MRRRAMPIWQAPCAASCATIVSSEDPLECIAQPRRCHATDKSARLAHGGDYAADLERRTRADLSCQAGAADRNVSPRRQLRPYGADTRAEARRALGSAGHRTEQATTRGL